MTVQVQQLPYIPPTNLEQHFDPWQFGGRRARAVSSKTGIAFSDYERIHVGYRSATNYRTAWTPPFANNNTQLRLVLAQQAWQFLHGGKQRVPDALANNCAALEKMCARRMTKRERQLRAGGLTTNRWNFGANVVWAAEHGGYIRLRTRIAYLSWRCQWTSPEIAEELQITPTFVRATLCRLCIIARKLGFETGRANYWRGKKRSDPDAAERRRMQQERIERRKRERAAQREQRKRKRPSGSRQRWTPERIAKLFALRDQDMSWQQCASELGLRHVNSAMSAYWHFKRKERQAA